MPCSGIRIRVLILEQRLEVTLATMVKPSVVPSMVNGSVLTDEIFSENVAFLRENIDHMFVLLMGAITCFLQVVSFFLHFYKNLKINSQSSEDMQVEYISQKYT